ncbi:MULTISPECIES: TonB-dependent receptor [Hyphomonas]|mgnify:CR=1 FL=1|uniref:TonB-dependent receptor n=1 Tax=Hyphomonas TaxID=85 RepID=UPI003001044C
MKKFGWAVSMGALLATGAMAQESAESRQDTIVVTGQKIDRSLQDTPVSVAVVTADQLEEENIVDLQDVIDRTANITSRDGSRFTIRGIDSLSVSGYGSGDLATIYINGSPLPREASFTGPADVWDVSQIEIFRGPQSTLQGRASLAGAILVNTTKPAYDWSGRVRGIYTTEENAFRLGAAFGGPILEDQLAFRVAVEHQESDGFAYNPVRDEDLDRSDSFSARGTLLLEPASVPGLEILLSYSRDEDMLGQEMVNLSTDDPEHDRLAFNNDPIEYNTVLDIATATVSYGVNDRWSLTSITGWNELDYDFVYDDDLGPSPAATRTFVTTTETLTEELRVQYDGDAVDGVFGIYLSKIDKPLSQSDGQLGIDLVDGLGLPLILQFQFGLDADTANFVTSQYPTPAYINSAGSLTQETETYAVFSDVSWAFADRWTLYGGLRYDVEEQRGTTESVITIASTLPDPTLYPSPIDQVIAGVNGFLVAEATSATAPLETFESPQFGGFLPKLGIGYDFDADRSLSFIVSRGYRSGGTAVNAARAAAFSYDQEFAWNYELAFRSQWLDNRLTLNANAFYLDWTDQQVSVQLSNNVFDSEVQNAGASHVIGLEVESSYEATDTLDLYGSVGYAKTEFDEFMVNINGAPTDFSGNEFAFAPHWTLNAGATWRPAENWVANVNANHATSAYILADRPQTSRDSDARTLVNFRAGWENKSFGIYLAGNNLLDEDYLITQFPNDPIQGDPPEFAQFGDPRTFSIQLEAKF